MITPSTVKELIEKLQQLPQDLPVYVRPKYTGILSWCDDASVNVNGVSVMETDSGNNVTFLV